MAFSREGVFCRVCVAVCVLPCVCVCVLPCVFPCTSGTRYILVAFIYSHQEEEGEGEEPGEGGREDVQGHQPMGGGVMMADAPLAGAATPWAAHAHGAHHPLSSQALSSQLEAHELGLAIGVGAAEPGKRKRGGEECECERCVAARSVFTDHRSALL